MEVKVLKTFEISDSLWKQIAEGFTESFERPCSAEALKTGFCVQNKLGYGYHALALSDEGELMGFNTFSPVFYKKGLKSVVSGSTFVRKKFRSNDLLFMDLMQALRKRVKDDGYLFEVGVPNHNSRNFAAKILKCKYIGDLNYYILPVHILKCIGRTSFYFMDYLNHIFVYIYVMLMMMFSTIVNTKEKVVKYELETDEEYWRARFDERRYSRYKKGNFHAYYRMYNEDGIKTAYLMDFREGDRRTFRALSKAVHTILKKEDVDAILFVGFLRMLQGVLIKAPRRFIPKPLPLTYYILNKADKSKFGDMDNVDNWNFSLMNFDVR